MALEEKITDPYELAYELTKMAAFNDGAGVCQYYVISAGGGTICYKVDVDVRVGGKNVRVRFNLRVGNLVSWADSPDYVVEFVFPRSRDALSDVVRLSDLVRLAYSAVDKGYILAKMLIDAIDVYNMARAWLAMAVMSYIKALRKEGLVFDVQTDIVASEDTVRIILNSIVRR